MALLQCMSHSPLMDINPVPDDVEKAVRAALEGARAAVSAYDPELCVIFFPDHYNAFSYKAMPQICVGTQARTIGDYGTKVFDLNVPEELAIKALKGLLQADFDPAVSYDMRVDHAVAQPLTLLFEDPSTVPVIPVFINCAAIPLGPFRRAWDLGAELGKVLRSLEKRVLLLGSGGLSHDPPIPRMSEAADAQRERLIAGNLGGPAGDEMARQERTAQFGKAFAEKSGMALGVHDLNPAWDKYFMDCLGNADEQKILDMKNNEIEEQAGRSAHESRVWTAAFGALTAFGSYRVEDRFYCAIPEWVAGFGLMRARSA